MRRSKSRECSLREQERKTASDTFESTYSKIKREYSDEMPTLTSIQDIYKGNKREKDVLLSNYSRDELLMYLQGIRKVKRQLQKKMDKTAWKYQRVDDASRGTYPQRVPAYNYLLDGNKLPQMKWITKSIDREGLGNVTGAESGFVAGCNCVDDCMDCGDCSCAQEMEHFPYNKEGQICLEPGEPIYECTSRCFCQDHCSNRVVQKGPQFKLELYKHAKKGWCVRSGETIPKGKFVAEYLGEIITDAVAEKTGAHNHYLYNLDIDTVTGDDYNVIDAKCSGNIAKFFNHSCEPNLQNYSVWIEHWDRKKPHIAFFSKRDIEEGEELTYDYHTQNVETGVDGEECHCLSLKCKKEVWASLSGVRDKT